MENTEDFMKRMRTLLVAMATMVALVVPASAAPEDDTTTSSITAGVQNLTVGHSQYAYFFFQFGSTCGTTSTYNTNGVRLSTSHPRYQDMVKSLQAAILSRAQLFVHYQNISGQCWAKRITLWNP